MKVCSKCKQQKKFSEFYKNASKKGGLSSYCKQCKYSNEKESLDKAKIWYNTWKSLQGCKKCGETRSYVLDLHHVDNRREGNKYKLLSRIISSGTYSFESRKNKILEEAKECIVLCSNCHREFHFFEKSEGLTLDYYLYN